MLKVESVKFRPATVEEVSQVKGNVVWQGISSVWTYCRRFMGSAQVLSNRGNVLALQTPYPQKFIDKFSYWLGYNPNYPFIESFYSFMGDRHYISNKTMMMAFFQHHRNSDLFESAQSVAKILDITREVFPEETFTAEDFMFTCTHENTIFYHKLIHQILGKTNSEKYDSIITTAANSLIHNWHKRCQNGEKINVTEQTRLFASSIITQVMFDGNQTSQDITESINFINQYLTKKLMRIETQADVNTYKDSLKIFRKAIENTLNNPNIPLFKSVMVTPAQKKAMIFLLFFAGQETTASLLNYMLWDLAKSPSAQQSLNSDADFKHYFTQAIHQFTPAFEVGRKFKQDTCLEYTLEGEAQPRKAIFFKGQFISARINTLAKTILQPKNYNDWLPFGSGPHTCPGKDLAFREIFLFLKTLLADFRISTKQMEPIPIVGYITSQLADDVYITIESQR